jgi:hypothetical protein
MKTTALCIGIFSLVGTILPPVLVACGQLGPEPMKLLMLLSCAAWFATAPLWMKEK